ncbi:MAG TPA: sigma-70 family RNA polymerase sigma factor [Gemmatimonadaceae bacterium]
MSTAVVLEVPALQAALQPDPLVSTAITSETAAAQAAPAYYANAVTDESSALFAEVIERGMEYAARLVDYDTARDVSHEIAVDIWERRKANPALLANASEVGPYVYRAVYNRILNVFRGQKRRRQRDEMHAAERSATKTWMDPALEQEERELAAHVQRVIDTLPRKTRAVYLRVREDGASYQEVAREMNISVKTVQYHVVHAQSQLRQALAEWNERGGTTR